MKLSNIDKACSLADERAELMKLRTEAVTNPITIGAAGTNGSTVVAISSTLAGEMIDNLLLKNAKELSDLGVTDIHPWRLPTKPPLKLDPTAFMKDEDR